MKYAIITYGCQMNEADSRLIAAVLDQAGWQATALEDGPDLIVINTCSVRVARMRLQLWSRVMIDWVSQRRQKA